MLIEKILLIEPWKIISPDNQTDRVPWLLPQEVGHKIWPNMRAFTNITRSDRLSIGQSVSFAIAMLGLGCGCLEWSINFCFRPKSAINLHALFVLSIDAAIEQLLLLQVASTAIARPVFGWTACLFAWPLFHLKTILKVYKLPVQSTVRLLQYTACLAACPPASQSVKCRAKSIAQLRFDLVLPACGVFGKSLHELGTFVSSAVQILFSFRSWHNCSVVSIIRFAPLYF